MKKDRLNGIICLIFSTVLIISALMLPESKVPDDIGPTVFPVMAGLMILIPALVMIFKPNPKADVQPFLAGKDEKKRFLLLVGVLFLYVICLYVAGFLIATPIVTFIICTMFSKGKKIPWWVRMLYSVILTAAIYLAFAKGLGLKLPVGEMINLGF